LIQLRNRPDRLLEHDQAREQQDHRAAQQRVEHDLERDLDPVDPRGVRDADEPGRDYADQDRDEQPQLVATRPSPPMIAPNQRARASTDLVHVTESSDRRHRRYGSRGDDR
jgi:hypothetical protein